MAKKKSELLREELLRFNKINSYYLLNEAPEDELPIGVPEEGFEEEEEEDVIDTEVGDEVGEEVPEEEVEEFGEEIPEEGGEEIEAEVDIEEEEVEEVDVTDIVNSTKDTAEKVESATSKIDDILSKFGDLEGRLSGMNDILHKIESLEREVEKRNPTPIEQLEMRSLDSFPFNVKLTDYWDDKKDDDTDNYEPIEKKEKEFDINVSDLSNYNSEEVKSSFDVDEDPDQM